MTLSTFASARSHHQSVALSWSLVGSVRIIRQVIACPDPLSIQLADMVDDFYFGLGYRLQDDPFAHPRMFTALNVSLTTWLRHPGWGLDSYRRHIRALRESEGALRQRRIMAGQPL